jgi:hypothetical protein
MNGIPNSWILFFATLQEASQSIERVQATHIQENIYSFKKGRIILTGMGRDAVLHCMNETTTEKELSSPELKDAVWVNLGIAGASKSFVVGQHVRVSSVSSLQTHDSIVLQTEFGSHLYTSLIPVHSVPEVLEKDFLIDMEGYFLASIARERGKTLRIEKVVSDYLSSETSVLIKKRLPMLSEVIANNPLLAAM